MNIALAQIHDVAALLPHGGEWHMVLREGLVEPGQLEALKSALAGTRIPILIDMAGDGSVDEVLHACEAAGVPAGDLRGVRALFAPYRTTIVPPKSHPGGVPQRRDEDRPAR